MSEVTVRNDNERPAGYSSQSFPFGNQFIFATEAAITEARKRADQQKHPAGVSVNEAVLLTECLYSLFAEDWKP